MKARTRKKVDFVKPDDDIRPTSSVTDEKIPSKKGLKVKKKIKKVFADESKTRVQDYLSARFSEQKCNFRNFDNYYVVVDSITRVDGTPSMIVVRASLMYEHAVPIKIMSMEKCVTAFPYDIAAMVNSFFIEMSENGRNIMVQFGVDNS